MEGRSKKLAILLLAVLPLLAVPIVGVSGASGSSLAVKVIASPTQVTEAQNFTMTVLISNNGKLNATGLGVCLVVPASWKLTLEGTTPSLLSPGTGCLLTQSSSESFSYTLSRLLTNQTELAQFAIGVPPGTSGGTYTLFVLLTSTTGNAQGNLVMTVQGLANLPLGSVLIPVSMILILLPGFVTVIIILWLKRSLSANWQTGLVAVFIAFFFGMIEWSFFTQPVPSFNRLTSTQLLNLDPTIIPTVQFVWVGIWAIILGLLVGFALIGVDVARVEIETLLNRASLRWSALRWGYVEEDEMTWKAVLKRDFLRGIELHGGGWLPQIRVTLSSPPGGDGKSVSAPSPPTVTVVDKHGTATVTETAKTSKVKESTTVESDQTTTTVTAEPGKGASPSDKKEDKIVRVGLLENFDQITPFDIVIAPPYTIVLDTEASKWKEVEDYLSGVILQSEKKHPKPKLKDQQAKGEKEEQVESQQPQARGAHEKGKLREQWLQDLNASWLPKDFDRKLPWILKSAGSLKVNQTHPEFVSAREWIKGGSFVTLEIIGPMKQYDFEFAQGTPG